MLLICLRRYGSKRRAISGYLRFLAVFLSLRWVLFLGFGVALWQGGAFFVVLAWLAFPCCLIGLLALPLCGGGAFFVVLAFLAFPCCLIGLLALPLCGAAPTFFAAAKKVGKEDSSNRQLISGSPGSEGAVVHLESVSPHIPLW
ncbi:hypothetical protein [Paraburkholderia sp. HD33-4]|uniref:hypothetical protein n=1 Tax=Paraburkholderia sp. HD33-4 TaxID=2883242 RepID=UPI001F3999A7|nr:hypothetical protein [Paraburkholderia sp. HD33-4]